MPRLSTSSFENFRVLVVEDDRHMLDLVCRLLREIGVGTIEPAYNGFSAFEKLEAGQFDLVIADWMMAPINGLNLLEHMRSDSRWSDLPFLMLTGKGDLDDVSIAKSAGVNGYLLKPFRMADLRKQLERLLCSA
jgi:two-component system chemotaxis response regulator CheY